MNSKILSFIKKDKNIILKTKRYLYADSTPNNMYDFSAYRNHGVFGGSTIFKKFGNLSIIDVSTAGSLVTIPKNPSVNNVVSITFRTWIYYVGAGTSNTGRIFDKGIAKYFYIDAVNNKLIFNKAFSTAAGQWETANSTLATGNWYCIQLTYDSSSVANNAVIMIDGVSKAITRSSIPNGTPSDDSGTDLIIGNRPAADRYVNSYLSETEIQKKICTIADGRNWYNERCQWYGKSKV